MIRAAAPPSRVSRLTPWDADHYEVRRVAARWARPEPEVWRAPASAVTLAFAGILEDEYAERVRERAERLDAAYLTSAIHTTRPQEIFAAEQREVDELLFDSGPPEDAIARARAAGLLPPGAQ